MQTKQPKNSDQLSRFFISSMGHFSTIFQRCRALASRHVGPALAEVLRWC
jgi:hypothetical protein